MRGPGLESCGTQGGQDDERDGNDNPGAEADAMGGSSRDEDARCMPNKPTNMLQCVSKCLEKGREENISERPPERPVDTSSETAVRGSPHNVQKCPREVRNECTDETDAPRRDNSLGGHLDLP